MCEIKVGQTVFALKVVKEDFHKSKKKFIKLKVTGLYPYGFTTERKAYGNIIREFFQYNAFKTGECYLNEKYIKENRYEC